MSKKLSSLKETGPSYDQKFGCSDKIFGTKQRNSVKLEYFRRFDIYFCVHGYCQSLISGKVN